MLGARDTFNARVVHAFAEKLLERIEGEDALPLPSREWDVVIDDPSLTGKHEYRRVTATTPLAAGVKAYQMAMRDEGFRCVAGHPQGDEQTLGVARECGPMWSVVHRAGHHPAIDYSKPPVRIVREEQVTT